MQLDRWDVSKVTTMSHMFYNMKAFNGAMFTSTHSVTDMHRMFFQCSEFPNSFRNRSGTRSPFPFRSPSFLGERETLNYLALVVTLPGVQQAG